MARLRKGVRYTLIGAAALVVLLVIALVVLTRTDFGVERAGQFALDQLRGSIAGELEVGRIRSGGLLRGVTLYDVAIDDPEGRPFLRADSARLAYRIRTLLGGDIAFDRLILHSPEVVIERLPGQELWNYEQVFPGDTTAQPDTATVGNLVLIEDVTVVNGTAIVRMPWEPEGPVEPGDTARLILEDVPGGIARVMRFHDIDGRLPRILWEAPDQQGKLIQIDEIATRAYIWETPVEIERAEGVITIRDSLMTIAAPTVRLPSSEAEVVGTIILGEPNRYDISIQGDDLAFADFQWLYPQLPEEGGGALQLRMQSQEGENILWLAEAADLQAQGSEVVGSFGVVTGDTLYFTNVELRADPLDLDLIRQLLPMDIPLDGLLMGTVEVEGPISALRTRGDMRFAGRGQDTGESAARWAGTVGLTPPYAVRDLIADVRTLELGHVARYAPALRLRGTGRGQVRAEGSVEHGLRLDGFAELVRDGFQSAVRGGGEFALVGDSSRFDLRLDARPVALELLGEQVPEVARLIGAAEGPVTIRGSLRDLHVEADLSTAAGGVDLRARLALGSDGRRYRAEGAVTRFQLDHLVRGIPETAVTGRFSFDVAGQRLADLDGELSADVQAAEVAGVAVRSGRFRGGLADGVLRVDSLDISTEAGTVSGRGALGLVDGAEGELAVEAELATLSPLEPLVFPGDELDELRPRLNGRVRASGTLSGNIASWSARGTVQGRDLLYDRTALGSLASQLQWSPGQLAVTAEFDSLGLGHRMVTGGAVELRIADGAGTAAVRARGPGAQRLTASGAFLLADRATDIQLHALALSTREGVWELQDTSALRVGEDGLRVEDAVLLRGPGFGRIRVSGVLPWVEDPSRLPIEAGVGHRADLALQVDSLRLGELLRVTQSDSTLEGSVSGSLRVTGSALAPVVEGQVAARGLRYHSAVLDSASGRWSYRDHFIEGAFQGWQGGLPILIGDGTLPVDLALTPRGSRLPDRPMRVRLAADSLPAVLASFLIDGFREVAGTVDGEVDILGTPAAPELRGEVRLARASAVFEPLSVRYHQVDVLARMDAGSRIQLKGQVVSRNGRADLRGSLDLAQPTDPAFDIDIVAEGFDASHRADVVAVADGQLHLGGSYRRPIVRGDVRLVHGELDIDEVWRQYQIVQLDTSLFQLFDTTTVAYRPPPENPFIRNVRLEGVTVRADGDVWVRSRELNVEVTGELEVQLDRQVDDLRMFGSMEARRGTYDLQFAQAPGVPARRFDIRQGTIDFVGTPGIDPNLDISAGYRVRRAEGEPIDVVARVTGSVQDPRVSLSSDSDLPLSESDLASYILFGRAGTELSQAETDIVSSGLSLVRPVITGFASSQLQRAFSSLGLDLDYIALRTPEYGSGDFGGPTDRNRGVLDDAQVEVGLDITRDVFVVGSYRLNNTGRAPAVNSGPLDQIGLRVEYRFLPTWTGEFYLEDRFARMPSFGLAEIDDRKVKGFSIFREWGY